ncbi:MAG: DUF748 domain-containing protein [Bdellovibrionales bacterium]|nr:DUF748 domain-containing protein [Bdellovibrionales bacterium]
MNFHGIIPLLDIGMSGTKVDLTKDFLKRLKKNEEKKEATTEEKKKFQLLSYIGTIELRDFNLSFTDGTRTLFTHLLSLDLDFPAGKGSVKGITATLREEDLRLLEVADIDLSFHSDGILGEESAELGVLIEGPKIRLARKAIKSLKKLMTFPSDPEKDGPSLIKELSYIRLNNARVHDDDRHIAAFAGKLAVDFENGTSVMQDLRADWRHTGRKLASVGKISGSFSPDNLVKGKKPDLRLIITSFRMVVGKELQNLLKSGDKKKSTGEAPDVPFTISHILVGSSSVNFPDKPGIGAQKNLAIREIFGHVNNLTMTPGTPLASFNFNATFEGKARLITNGKLDLAHVPPQASVDFKLFNFDMKKLNPEFRKKIPLTFQEGEFNLLGEVVKRDKDIVGYFKPFLVDASYLGNKKEFKNTRHFFAEIGATITNWLFENSKTETVATRVPFVVKNGSIDFKAGEALWNAVEHGVLESKRVKPGGEKYELRQAEEERKDNKKKK